MNPLQVFKKIKGKKADLDETIQSLADNEKAIVEGFLKNADSETLEALVKEYISRETFTAFSNAVKIAGIDFEKEKKAFLSCYESLNTREAYRRAIDRLEEYASRLEGGKGKSPASLNPMEADDFIESLKAGEYGPAGKKRSNESVRRDVAAVSSFFTFLERRHKNIQNPFRGTRSRPEKKASKERIYPEEKEVKVILQSLEPALKAAVYIMAYRGLRVGALPDLKIKGHNFSSISKGKTITGTFSENVIKEIEKAGLDPEKPFSYLKEPFKNGRERKATAEQTLKMQLQSRLKKLYKDGKIKACYSPHDFRHFFAAGEYQKDKDIYRVSRLLGHKSIATTQVYLKSLNILEEN